MLVFLATDKYVMVMLLIGEFGLPQRVVCHECGHVLYEGFELRPPDEIISQNGGKCPKCNRKLSLLPLDVEVKPISKR
jgi:hypothetical protein